MQCGGGGRVGQWRRVAGEGGGGRRRRGQRIRGGPGLQSPRVTPLNCYASQGGHYGSSSDNVLEWLLDDEWYWW